MRVGCLGDGRLEDIGPPLTIVYVGDGCGGYSGGLFVLAGSELAGEYGTLTGHVFFLDFGDEYQDLTKYSLIQQLNLPTTNSKKNWKNYPTD